jgi:ribose transport system permease protein
VTAATATIARPNPFVSALRKNTWTIGLIGFLLLLILFTKVINGSYGATGIQNLGIAVLPLAFAAVGQAIVIITGGIDLSIGSTMALTSVISAAMMKDQPGEVGIAVVLGVLLLGMLLGLVNGGVVVFTRVPDIVVTLAMSFVWAGISLIVINTPGGGSAQWLKDLTNGSIGSDWIPRSLLCLIVAVALVWVPLRRSRTGLALYALGSDRLAAFRSGVSVGRTKVLAYALTGLFSALGGLSLTGITGIGSPVPGGYTLLGVAAIVLGGVSLAGGRGGVLGPILAVFVLQLVRSDLTFLNVDPNLATVIQGSILIGVVMFGSVVAMRKARG